MNNLKNEETRINLNKEVNKLLKETKNTRNQSIVEEEWKKLRDTMINAAEKNLKYTKETPIKTWINSKIIDVIKKRRMY